MLDMIGKMIVPPSVRTHRFFAECLAAIKVIETNELRGGVVGTGNTKQPELYGWRPNVLPHVDKSGIVYFMPVVVNGGTICAGDFDRNVYADFPLELGAVYRLDDREYHWTTDDSYTVCIFLGSFEQPNDYLAMQSLSAALAKLAAGEYYGAPRAGRGFRAVLADECLIDNGDSYDYKLLTDATKDNDLILTCSVKDCNDTAVFADRYYPYFAEQNRCAKHFRQD